jgi:protein MAK11
VIVAGTYDGVLAGWETQDRGGRSLELTFATPIHQGSIRSLSLAAPSSPDKPGTILSCGYDEELKTHDWSKKLHSSGQVRTPADFGTPTCSAFAPPTTAPSTHCMLGFSGGKIVVYKKRDWSIQHVLEGHKGGVASVAVHPTGRIALTGGMIDGTLKLWDLTRGRIAYTTKLPSVSKRNEPVDSLEWSADGTMYGWCSGNRVTVRATDSGKDLLDAEVPSRINELVLMEGGQGVFVAAACNDGSLPVLAVQALDGSQQERRAILAIEPVDNPVAGEERFKCIRKIEAYRVATCNSAGVVSVMNLEGAVRMILSDSTDENSQGVQSDDENDSEEDEELAVDIVESVRLGTGARITCLAVWYSNNSVEVTEDIEKPIATVEEEESVSLVDDATTEAKGAKRKQDDDMDTATVEKARSLVKQAKKIKKKSQRKKKRVAEA